MRPEGSSPYRNSAACLSRRIMAAFSLSKAQLANILGVSPSAVAQWLSGNPPRGNNIQRLAWLAGILDRAGLHEPYTIRPEFLRKPLLENEPPLIELLQKGPISEASILKAIAKALELEASEWDSCVEKWKMESGK